MPSRALALPLLLLTACAEDPAPAPAPAAAPSTSPDTPRGAQTAEGSATAPTCEGRSIDPPQLAFLVAQGNDGDVDGALEGLEALAGAHPSSATARVALGELSLRTQPPRAESAERWMARALALHEEGCTLGDRDLWAALEGAAIARIVQGDYAGARPFLERSLARWPSARATRYNLACALCRTGDVEGCGEALHAVLHGEDPPPPFLGDQRRPTAHYVDMARADPDLAPLRADAARFARALEGA